MKTANNRQKGTGGRDRECACSNNKNDKIADHSINWLGCFRVCLLWRHRQSPLPFLWPFSQPWDNSVDIISYVVAGWHVVALRSITAGPAIHGLSNAYSSPVGLPSIERETGSRTDKGCTGVGGSLPVITNGYEEPPYLLTLKRIWCQLSDRCLTARTALTVMSVCYEGGEGPATACVCVCMCME